MLKFQVLTREVLLRYQKMFRMKSRSSKRTKR